MDKKKAITIAAVIILLLLQVIHPIFKGDVLLDIPQRIRTAFTQLFDWHEEEEEEMGGVKNELDPNQMYQLEQGEDTPMKVFEDKDMVDLPEEDGKSDTPNKKPEGNQGNQSGGGEDENELPMDNFGG